MANKVNTFVREENNKLKGQFGILISLTTRHLQLFFKNKMTFFFSLLVPMITIIVYFLFLRGLEAQSIRTAVDEMSKLAEYPNLGILSSSPDLMADLQTLVDEWMLSGVLAVSCITISFNTCYIMNGDQENGVNRDFASSPISKNIIIFSYFLYNFVVTLLINLVVFAIIIFYTWGISGIFVYTFGDILLMLLIIVVSVFSSTLITIFIASFNKIARNFNSVIAIVSTGIGFLIGAYMPTNMTPFGVQDFCLIIPGTYSTALLRNAFLSTPIESFRQNLTNSGIPASEVDGLIKLVEQQYFTMNLDFKSGTYNSVTQLWDKNVVFSIDVNYMIFILFGFIILALVLNLLFARHNLDVSLNGGKIKKNKKKEAPAE